MRVLCRIESAVGNPTPMRDNTAQFSRVPAKGEHVCVFSDADVLAYYLVSEVVHHERGEHYNGEFDATLQLTAAIKLPI
ncbi:hypothetical protein [Sorangium sp. So ce1335]|uniref:hypothetical protein n=1 Tax=Sorangium sp. So ce1335 TaxID=3133335 RepID=UPI003F5E20A5